MPTALELTALNALTTAADAEVGIIFRVEQAPTVEMVTPSLRAKQMLYRFRKEFGDPRFANIQIRLSPDNPDDELWLINTRAITHEAATPATEVDI
jgi:hypothetical protein